MVLMKKDPLVSVIVPTYNRAHTLERTLGSIYAQTFHDYEIILVDDGSTDGTGAFIEKLKRNTLKYVFQENKGVAEARNTGVRTSSGTYVAFCDSDDFWLPKKLEKQMRLFTDDIALVYSDVYLFEDPARPKGKGYEFMTPYRGFVYAELLRKNFIGTSSVIVKKSHLNKPFAGQTCEDWQMWLSVAKHGRFDYVDEPLVYYYEHSQGLSKSKARVLRARLAIRKQEIRSLQGETAGDRALMKDVNRLIKKDMLFLCLLNMLPEKIMKRIDQIYYSSKVVRKVMTKTPLSS